MTPRERDAHDVIRNFIEGRGYSPSRAEICKALGITSRAHVQRLIKNLRDQGLLTYEPRRSRSIRLIDPADSVVRAAERLVDSIVEQSPAQNLAVVHADALDELESALAKRMGRRRSPAGQAIANHAKSERIN